MTYLIGLIIALGLISSYQDITQKKVRNSLLLLCFAVYLFLVLFFVWDFTAIPPIALNGVVATLVSVGIWMGGIWPAGDTKLFALMAFMVPLQYYEKHYYTVFPSFVLLVNIFSIAVAMIMLLLLRDLVKSAPAALTKSNVKAALKYLLSTAAKDSFLLFLKSLLITIFIFIVARIVSDIFFAYGDVVFRKFVSFSFLITFVLFRQIMQFIRKRLSLTSCVLILFLGIGFRVVATGYNIDAIQKYMIGVVINALVFMGGMQTLMICSNYYFKLRHVYKITPAQLKSGMLLETQCLQKVQVKFKEMEVGGRFRPDGLSDDQICTIQKCFGPEEELSVCKTFPFAPVIFMGVLLTMYTRDSVIHLVKLILT